MREILYPILDAIGPTETIGSRQPREQQFLAPGTWTCPATTTWVQVLVVGGGGGAMGAYNFPPGIVGGSGGGGGVRLELVPVSAPVPITVGAGGTGGRIQPTVIASTAGGTSAFGPVSPPVPANTIQVGGGGGGVAYYPGLVDPFLPVLSADAPANGGGGGGGNLDQSYNGAVVNKILGKGGTYGTGATRTAAGGAGYGGGGRYDPSTGYWIANPPGGASLVGAKNYGRYGYGGGGGCVRDGGGSVSGGAGTANTGGGAQADGGGTPYAGGSGIVIVRWWQ